MAKMSKSQIISTLADKTGMAKKDVAGLMEAMVNLAFVEVKKSGEFVIHGIGKLVKVNRKARVGRNPATGAAVNIPAKTVVKFRVAKAAKEAVL
jgi:DNA-binding protein HU-beta